MSFAGTPILFRTNRFTGLLTVSYAVTISHVQHKSCLPFARACSTRLIYCRFAL